MEKTAGTNTFRGDLINKKQLLLFSFTFFYFLKKISPSVLGVQPGLLDPYDQCLALPETQNNQKQNISTPKLYCYKLNKLRK